MTVTDLAPADIGAVYRFLCGQGWTHRLGSEERFAQLIGASQRTAVALDDDGRVAGFARAITDGISNGYLSMVAVRPDVRRQGLGRRRVIERYRRTG